MRRRGAGGSLPHDLSVEVDPAGLTARFADDVTFVSAGAGDLYVLLGADAVLERVSGPEGQDVAFSRAYGWLSLPFAVYRIASPGIERGREFSLRFEWHITPGTVRFVNPFVALHFFHLGFDALWYPHMPGEETSASLLYAKAYRPYVLSHAAPAPGGRGLFRFDPELHPPPRGPGGDGPGVHRLCRCLRAGSRRCRSRRRPRARWPASLFPSRSFPLGNSPANGGSLSIAIAPHQHFSSRP